MLPPDCTKCLGHLLDPSIFSCGSQPFFRVNSTGSTCILDPLVSLVVKMSWNSSNNSWMILGSLSKFGMSPMPVFFSKSSMLRLNWFSSSSSVSSFFFSLPFFQ